VLPRDISRDQLMAVMRAASTGLGVRCHYCHVARPGGNENSLADLDFKSDQKPEKETARTMMRMVQTINTDLLARLPERNDPPVNVPCVTCHRGSALPSTLDRVLAEPSRNKVSIPQLRSTAGCASRRWCRAATISASRH
jgi:hypothetical protein